MIATAVGAGWRVNERLAVGAVLSYNHMRMSQSRKVSPTDLLTPAGEQPGPLALGAQAVAGDVILDYRGVDHGLGWTVGLLYDPLPWLSVGLSYHGGTVGAFEGPLTLTPARGDADALAGAVGAMGYKMPRGLTIEQPVPHSIFAGINVRIGQRLELGLDYRIWLYSLFDEQRISPAYDADDQGQELLSAEQLSRRIDYPSSHQVAFGGLVRPFASYRQLELLAGVIFDRSPVPDETFTIDSPSLDFVTPLLGARWQSGSWRIWASYAVYFYFDRDIRSSRTSPPTNIDVGGRRHVFGLGMEYVVN